MWKKREHEINQLTVRASLLATDFLFSTPCGTIAACLDDEMASRIAKHQAGRGHGWTTREAPINLVEALEQTVQPGHIVLVDCLTLWLSNLVHHDRNVDEEIRRLLDVLALPGELILVSNEIGLGLVPGTPLGRSFRDQQGWLNQAVAEASDRVEFVAAGLPLVLK